MPILCPRCNRIGYAFKAKRGGKYYVYVKHATRVEGRIRYEYCYVGPANSYDYVHRVHGELGLTNVVDQDYVATVFSAVEKQLQLVERLVNQGKRREAEELLKKLLDALGSAARRVSEFAKALGVSTG